MKQVDTTKEYREFMQAQKRLWEWYRDHPDHVEPPAAMVKALKEAQKKYEQALQQQV